MAALLAAFKLAVKNGSHPSRRDCWENKSWYWCSAQPMAGWLFFFMLLVRQASDVLEVAAIYSTKIVQNVRLKKIYVTRIRLLPHEFNSISAIYMFSCTVCGYTLLCNYDTGVWHPAKKKKKKKRGWIPQRRQKGERICKDINWMRDFKEMLSTKQRTIIPPSEEHKRPRQLG